MTQAETERGVKPWMARRHGPSPSLIPGGDGEDARVIAEDLSPTLVGILRAAPEGDFKRFGLLLRSKIFDSAIRRGFIEACGYHREGQWQYRLSFYGEAVKRALPRLPPKGST